ncbi:transporter substrate-binding domain-containing protein [Brevibacillus humidisoli]|uniref:transporter substrate-binding domain-containing protein n=1 Tax=Brevibacillus humidisoli TaxID=2895522 RepID=UPI001E43337B|nr:transporter substrate-binding domain-containing protein [Brevibacillus humidisoli]UFJ39981.1 transporter substrate-binding domain-containing protein [Brevibacillus humidisoli]
MLRLLSLLAVIVLAGQSSPAAARTGSLTDGVIRVAYDHSLPPFSYVDESGEAGGFTIALIHEIAKTRGLALEYVPLDWGEAVARLAAGDVDVIVGMKYTSARDRLFDFSESFFTMSEVLLVPKQDKSIRHLNDLKGRVVAVQRASVGVDLLESVRRVKMLVAFSQQDALDYLHIGRAEAFLGNPWTAQSILEKRGEQDLYETRSGLINPADYAFAVREGNYRLLQELNSGLSQLVQDGTYGRLYSRYFEPYSAHIADWWRKLVTLLLAVTALIALVLVFGFFWNKRLKYEVKRQTTALADSFAFQSQVLNSVDSAIIAFNLDGSITLRNQITAHLLGIGEECLGRRVDEYLPELPIQEAIEQRQQLFRGELVRQEGGSRFFHYYIAPLYSSVGEVIGGIVSLQDRTEQKHLQARLVDQEKMRALGQLVAGIAHELRNPLTAIKTFIELLPGRLDDPHFRAELIRHVPVEVERLNRIVEDLLDYARSQPMQTRAENLREMVDWVLGLFARRLHHEQVLLTVEVPPHLTVRCDRARIKQVLINLVVNGLEAMEQTAQKQLLIRAGSESGAVVLTIADTGEGIASDYLPRLFQPFFTTKSQGIGLGLHLSRKIMREHGGELTVERSDGTGTTFRLVFADTPLSLSPGPTRSTEHVEPMR